MGAALSRIIGVVLYSDILSGKAVMVKSCCAVGCSARYSKGCELKFHRFPKDPKRRREWIAAVNRKNWEPTEYSWICNKHFVGGKKSDEPDSPAYIPTIFDYIKSPQKRKREKDLCRFNRFKESKRRRVEIVERARVIAEDREKENNKDLEREQVGYEIEKEGVESEQRNEAVEALLCLSTVEPEVQDCSSQVSACTMTETTMKDLEAISCERDDLLKECDSLKCQNVELLSQLVAVKQALITPESLLDNDAKVKYFTGLPSYKVLKAVFDFVSPCFKTYSRTVLPLFNQFLMVLARLRINMDTDHLSYQFGIHTSNVSRTIRKWINVLYERLGVLIKWPEREELYKTMPTDFKPFGKCVVIIDCFEVFMERPSSLKPRAQTWSNYKQHNTCKFLIGITPQGSISFVSKAWGGRTSDVYLTEQCGLLSNLINGDLVLADRGFTIHNSVSHYLAEVKVPSFTKGKPQLSKYEVDTTQQLARVRIHVERVIGMLKQKYKILNSILPVSLIMCDPDSSEEASMIDKIVVICAALCNCCNSVIPSE